MLTMNAVCFLFLGAIALSSAKKLSNIEICEGNVKSVDVSPCSDEPCVIPKGGFVDIKVTCISNVNSEKLRLSVYADLAGIEVPYPGMKRDACKGKNITCPIREGQEITYHQRFSVKKFFPSIKTTTRWLLKTNDEQDKDICCFKTPVEVGQAVVE